MIKADAFAGSGVGSGLRIDRQPGRQADCLSVCLSVFVSVCLSVCLSVYLSAVSCAQLPNTLRMRCLSALRCSKHRKKLCVTSMDHWYTLSHFKHYIDIYSATDQHYMRYLSAICTLRNADSFSWQCPPFCLICMGKRDASRAGAGVERCKKTVEE